MNMKEGPNAWPADVAFKRLVRELWRQRNYVPPYQNLPPAVAVATSAEQAAPPEQPPALWRKNGWELDVTDNGDVVLRHDSGKTVVLATTEGDTDG